MLPTHVGMNREIAASTARVTNAPHTRGDEPKIYHHHYDDARNAPHTRGDEPLGRAGCVGRFICSPHTWG